MPRGCCCRAPPSSPAPSTRTTCCAGWRVAPLSAQPSVELAATARPTARLRARGSGPALLVAAVRVRRGPADPYEVAVRVPGPAGTGVLTLEQYGNVLNLLESAYPAGVEVSTYDLRRNCVDVTGDAVPDFLTSTASRTYHRHRRRRPLGPPGGRRETGT